MAIKKGEEDFLGMRVCLVNASDKNDEFRVDVLSIEGLLTKTFYVMFKNRLSIGLNCNFRVRTFSELVVVMTRARRHKRYLFRGFIQIKSNYEVKRVSLAIFASSFTFVISREPLSLIKINNFKRKENE